MGNLREFLKKHGHEWLLTEGIPYDDLVCGFLACVLDELGINTGGKEKMPATKNVKKSNNLRYVKVTMKHGSKKWNGLMTCREDKQETFYFIDLGNLENGDPELEMKITVMDNPPWANDIGQES